MTDSLWPALQAILPDVARPVRYIDSELNRVEADLDAAGLAVALIYPDTYEVGSSNVGLGILYEILSQLDGVAVDRAYCPWPDMEARLRAEGIPLFGLASRRSLTDFDVLAITLQYEMTFTNVLNVLDLAGLPVRAADRGDEAPLVLGGGPCACNPEPVAPFFDAILVGDGEEAVVEIARVLCAMKEAGARKIEVLRELVGIEGVYVPSFYEPRYRGDGRVSEISRCDASAPATVRRRVVADLNSAAMPSRPVVPFADVVHDRLALEIMRGCTRGCRFCQAGMAYRPVRERDAEAVVAAAERLIAATGYDDLSLLSLSSLDYSCIAELVQSLCARLAVSGTALSLPSGRVDAFSVALARSIAGLKKTGLTFAPEAGTQRLRDVINKQVTQEDFERTIAEAFSSGWKRVKLYFMIGLPTETEDDVLGIADMISAGTRSARAAGAGGGPLFNVSVSSLVPKSASPFMWAEQDDLETIAAKQALLREKISRKSAKFHWHDSRVSMIEGVLARGDRRLADVIEEAWRLGCRLDAWSEHFQFDLWLRALDARGISPEFYLRMRDDEEVFPWGHISSGVSQEFLLEEWHKAQSGVITGDCRSDGCSDCGACANELKNCLGRQPKPEAARAAREESAPDDMFRLRVRYAKSGSLRFLSHLEVCHALERAARRAALPIALTRGFSPKMRVSYGPPLPVGFAGQCEYADLFLTQRPDASAMAAKLDEALPGGLDVRQGAYVDRSASSISAIAEVATYDVDIRGRGLDVEAAGEAFRLLWDQETLEVQRKGQCLQIRLSESVREIEEPKSSGEGISQRVSIYLGRAHQLRPEALLVAALAKCGARHDPPLVTRTGLFALRDEELVDVMEVSR